ncbi:hypothetical protein [Methylosinus sp. Ce-a6]|uniref:hypothetical protein n=1 Tax=Methylosinus sp. Ce-a6 TaxID=2172005 RepID=UPI001358FFFB|nr:hypothetical protein [Methylosinus sp. Ce-a6]
MRDTAVLGLSKSNITVLKEQLRVTRHRQDLGELSVIASAALAVITVSAPIC